MWHYVEYALWSLACQVVPDVLKGHIGELGCDSSNRIAVDLGEGWTSEIARKLEAWRCGHRSAVHGQRE